MRREELAAWLRERNPRRLDELWARADRVRREHVGDAVHLRGLIEIGNHCRRRCAYCGIAAYRMGLERYRLGETEILAAVTLAQSAGLGTVVLQAGEDPGLTCDFVAALIRRIKRETPLAVTLSLGEREPGELAEWREAGADRYLLRLETSDPALLARIHPPLPGVNFDRLTLLAELRRLGYEVGSGVMVGIPGQSYTALARDLELFRELELDMIGLGPYLPDPATPLGRDAEKLSLAAAEQVPRDETAVLTTLALARLLCPSANIPSTTGLASLAGGYRGGLGCGANVVMPNLTPLPYRALYAIYPAKVCRRDTPTASLEQVFTDLRQLARPVGGGRGDSPQFHSRSTAQE